jgi:DNA-directed RNA polymerase subunit K/omega
MDEFGLINYIADEPIEEDTQVSVKDNLYHTHVDVLKNYDLLKQGNRTKNKLTKYEVTKIIGVRSEMLAAGARPLINVPKHVTDVQEIAEIELEQRKIPFIIRREISGGYEYWKIEDMVI